MIFFSHDRGKWFDDGEKERERKRRRVRLERKTLMREDGITKKTLRIKKVIREINKMKHRLKR